MKPYDSKTAYCGVGWFKLEADHPFNIACYHHDLNYEVYETKDTNPIDIVFKVECDAIANAQEDPKRKNALLAQSKIFYRLTRIWGTMRYRIAKARGWKYILGDDKK